jgi:uncharacterized protein
MPHLMVLSLCETFMNALLVVAKRPAPGQTKTRLAPPLTPMQAARLYEAFLQDTLDVIRRVPRHLPDMRLMIAYLPDGAPDGAEDYFRALAPDFTLLPQRGADLGERLDNALTHCLANGHHKAVIMDSDSPTLPVGCLVEAFERLDEVDVTLGPCDDGGYYLIGMKHPHPRLLREVRMSTPNVTADTLALAAEMDLQIGLLPAWYDVDDYPTLRRLFAELTASPMEAAPQTRAILAQLHHQTLFSPSPGDFTSHPTVRLVP